MIERETIDKIFDTANIVEVVGDFINLKKRGVNYLGNCPFHNEKTPSFTVSPSKGIYKCFGCGAGGNSVNFIMEHEKLSYIDALKFLARKYHIEVVEKEMTPAEKEKQDVRESLIIVSEFAGKTFTDNLHNSDEGRAVGLKYFKERGFNDSIIDKFQLGYCRASRDSFTLLAENKGYKTEYLVTTGLTVKRDDGTKFDRFSERVMFPIHNLMGRIIGFGGRTLRSDKKIAKYLNSPESEIYHKSKILYGLFFSKNAIVKNDKCFLVEGYTDVMSMHQSGIENVVASSGTSLTTEQIKLIKRFTSNITVLFDGDAAGIKAALRGIDMVLKESMNVKVVLLPDGEDPDSFAQKHSATQFYDFIEREETDFIRFKTKLLLEDAKDDPVKKAELIKDIVKTVSVIPDNITRSLYAKECSFLLNMEEAILVAEIDKLNKGEQRKQFKEEQKHEEHTQPVIEEPAITEKSINEKFDEFEKEIVRILLKHGKTHLFTVAQTLEESEQKVFVSQYIARELRGEIEIKSPVFQTIINEFETHFNSNPNFDVKYFVNHENPLISKTTADLLSEKHTLSRIHSQNGSQTPAEERNLKEVIDQAISGYKYNIVMDILHNIEAEMKRLENRGAADEELSLTFEKFILYTQMKREIAKSLGNRIVLKR